MFCITSEVIEFISSSHTLAKKISSIGMLCAAHIYMIFIDSLNYPKHFPTTRHRVKKLRKKADVVYG